MDFELFSIFIDIKFKEDFLLQFVSFGLFLKPSRSLFSVGVSKDDYSCYSDEVKELDGWYLNLDLFFIHLIKEYKICK